MLANIESVLADIKSFPGDNVTRAAGNAALPGPAGAAPAGAAPASLRLAAVLLSAGLCRAAAGAAGQPGVCPMHREKLAWVVSVVLVAVLAFQLPGSMATRDDDYAWVGTLVEVHRRVVDNYVEPVNEDELRKGAINGLLGELDQYTLYVPPAQQEAFDRMREGT